MNTKYMLPLQLQKSPEVSSQLLIKSNTQMTKTLQNSATTPLTETEC